ncbi:MAG: hypothetical protein KatS3mg110_2030 [Pirellulaceae bacterium]|nr:MAG: hypothetical protein KatS3mg110_2030 [Pirellulaceae bacterium]
MREGTTRNSPSQNGEPAAQGWKQHWGWLRSVIVARLRGMDGADDVLHEVLAAALRSASMPDGGPDTARWLYRVAVRQALLYRRRHSRDRRKVASYAQQCSPGGPTDQVEPLALLVAEERRRRVRLALAHLPGRDAELLLLKYVHDWSYQQMANHLGSTPEAIKVRLHRARSKLRQLLNNEEL